jgi:hypothetical protein
MPKLPLRAFAFCLVPVFAVALAATEPPALRSLELVPTFESIGVYLTVDGSLDGLVAEISFRAAGTGTWRPALAPVACPAEHQFRGSVLLLDADTRYEITARLLRAGRVVAERSAGVRTWPEAVPVARDVVLPAGVSAKPLVITDRGSASGWIRYRAAPAGSTVDAGLGAPSAVVLDHAAYVIVEGLVVRGGTQHAIHVVDSHDVRIRGCDIAGWGDPGTWKFYRDQKRAQWAYLDAAGKIIDRQAGIRVRGAGSTRVVLEWNLIHHPRGTAACWAFTHPHGPSGIVLSETGGNHVVRDNDLVAGDGHCWNDAIESEYNGEAIGGPYRDTDLYGNLLVGANDDGTELDGGQMNVRYWHNGIEGGLCGVSCAPNLRGPSYVFRNVIVTSDERGASGAGFKMGGDPGVTFLLNNTVYTGGYGLTSGHYGKNPTPIFSRNNLFAGPAPGLGRVRFDRAVAGDLDRDVIPPGGLLGTDTPRPGREGGARFVRPRFVAAGERDFRLAPGSPGAGAGAALAGVAAAKENPGALGDESAAVAWPPRPDAPRIFPGRRVVRIRAGGRADIALRVTARAGLRWRATGGEPWVACSLAPESDGTMQPLVCHVDARTLPPGAHRTFVSVRAENGHLRSVPLEVEVEPAVTVVRRFEPEPAGAAAGFEVVRADDATAGRYVQAVAAAHPEPLVLAFDLPAPDRFFILARVRAAGPVAKLSSQDSLTLQIDDGKVMTWDLFGISDGAWQWIRATPQEAVTGVFALASGPHRLRLGGREPQVQVDEIVVSNNPFAP